MIANSYPFVKLDYTLPPEELVLNLINNDNGTEFCLGQLEFGIPKLLCHSRHNTVVSVSATEHSYWSGKTNLHYNRIDISKVVGDKSTTFEITTEVKLSDMIPAIDDRYSLNLTPADYVDVDLPLIGNIPNEIDTVDLVAANTSLVFINKVTLSLDRMTQILLSRVIPNFVLNGLVYSKPQLNALINY